MAASSGPSTATVRPSDAGDGERQRRPAARARVVEQEPDPDRRLRREPRLEGRDPVARVDLDPRRVGDRRGERRRQVVRGRAGGGGAADAWRPRVSSPAADPSDPEPSAAADVAACPTASKSSDSWSPPPSVGGRTGRAEPQPDGRAAPATRAAGTDPSVATPRSAAAASPAVSPVIAGRRSISVRNSYSRKSRMTVSRS